MLTESIKLALGNIGRTRLRHFLTMCGIMIGTGAIVSMVSFAVGMRSEMSRTIASSGLLTTVYVLPSGSALGQLAPGTDEHDPDDSGAYSDGTSANGTGTDYPTDSKPGSRTASARGSVPRDSTRGIAITDEAIGKIASIEGVTHAFPLVAFPAMLSRGSKQVFATVTGVPASMDEATKKRLEKGEVFSSENDSTLLVSSSFAKKLGVSADSVDSKSLHAGIPVTLTIITLGHGPFGSGAMLEGPLTGGSFSPLSALGLLMPFERQSFRFYVKGLLKESFFGPVGRADCYVPLKMAKRMSAMTIQDPGDVLRNPSLGRGGYLGAEVHVAALNDVESVTKELRGMSFTVFSISDQFKGMRTAFVLVSAFLGAIGGVALFVGCLGIVNVMLISVLERTREIGIMKSVGARRRDIMHLFVMEAALIGLVGGLLGVMLGWLVAEVTNHLMFAFIIKDQAPFHRLYEIPFWLSSGAVGLAIVVSIIAGLYPARRAAGLEPTAALRYE
ncbi:MAG: FtsX-like permease family protein [Candidatus Eisenbacteria bacterium]|nr:FtsX-like permease family protein [Candidatus Eisenbacteria bacterium]